MLQIVAWAMPTKYSGLNLNQAKATKPQTVQIVRQGEATPYWFKVNPLYYLYTTGVVALSHFYFNPLYKILPRLFCLMCSVGKAHATVAKNKWGTI